MQLPIDIKALIDEATNISAARATEISLSIYIDAAASSELAAHVRSTFASTAPNVRITLSYLDESFIPHQSDDFAILVAGLSRGVGAAGAAVRAAGVPVMVVTEHPCEVEELAEQMGYAIPAGDIVAPAVMDGQRHALELSGEIADQLDERMGQWIVAVCREKRLAMAIAFPFMRRSLATDAVQATSLQNAGIGLVPLIPGADLPIMTLNQAKMVLQIAAAYGQDMDKNRAKELAAVVGGAYLCRVVARELTEFVPVLGFAVKPTIAYGGTAAIGHAAIEYFEGGEDVAGVTNVAKRGVEAAGRFADKVRTEGPSAVPGLWKKAQGIVELAPEVRDKVVDYAPRVVAVVDELVSSVVAQSRTASA